MTKIFTQSIAALTVASIFSLGLVAQETKVTIQVKEDGKVVKDTTYSFEDAEEAHHVLKMVEVMTGEGLHEAHEEYTYTMHSDGDHASKMVFISKDGDKTIIKEIDGDSTVWVSDDGEVHEHGEHVIVMKKGDGETFDILMDSEMEEGHSKKIKVIVTDEGDGDYTIITDGEEGEHIKEITKVGEDGEEVKVIVVKKKVDSDHDHDEEVEVQVEKKVKKKTKKQ